MAGPNAKGGMWKTKNGKRVLITKSMAKQMAAAGMSAQDEGYADQAAKLRAENNAEAKAKRKADVEKRTIKDDNFGTPDDKKINVGLVNVKRIQSQSSQKFDSKEIDKMANDILKRGGLINPIVVERTGNNQMKVISGEKELAAAKRAREIDPRKGENINIIVAKNSKLTELGRQDANPKAVRAQLELFNKHKAKNDRLTEGLNTPDKLSGGRFIQKQVSIKRIESGGVNFPSKDVDRLAKAILANNGTIKPVILKRTGANSYKVVGNHLAYAAYQRARQINPRRAEMANVVVFND